MTAVGCTCRLITMRFGRSGDARGSCQQRPAYSLRMPGPFRLADATQVLDGAVYTTENLGTTRVRATQLLPACNGKPSLEDDFNLFDQVFDHSTTDFKICGIDSRQRLSFFLQFVIMELDHSATR